MKNILPLILMSFLALQMSAVNVTIIESQSGNSWAYQDTVWADAATSLGYIPTIAPQNTLDDISNLSNTDVLVISSGTIMFPSATQIETIEQFVLGGRSVYVQSEYLSTFQGNITFGTLMENLGVDFTWLSTVSGSLVPMNITGVLSTTPNDVTTLDYFNYGFGGEGTGVEKFLEYDGNYCGFYYSDPTSSNGAVITTSDEDWAWNNASPQLMENILYNLANTMPSSTKNLLTREASLNIYPNPSFSDVTIEISKFINNVTIEVYNTLGQQVKQMKNVNSQVLTLQRGELPEGTYFIRLTKENEIINIDQLVIVGS